MKSQLATLVQTTMVIQELMALFDRVDGINPYIVTENGDMLNPLAVLRDRTAEATDEHWDALNDSKPFSYGGHIYFWDHQTRAMSRTPLIHVE